MKGAIKAILFSAVCFILAAFYFGETKGANAQDTNTADQTSNAGNTTHATLIDRSSPPCLQMHYAIEKYAEAYSIPINYAYGIAYCETRYSGPFDWKYKHSQESYAGAIGPMQIMPSTADLMWKGENVSREKLMNDIEFNVQTSMKLMRKLHDRYNDWKMVFGCYNTGRPCVNDYALNVFNYKPKFKLN